MLFCIFPSNPPQKCVPLQQINETKTIKKTTIMKTKNYILQLMLIALTACFTLTSCEGWQLIDDDYDQSKVLSGQWQGDFGMNYIYRYNGRNYTFDSYDTDVIFYPDHNGATYGWGKQVDWYEYGPYEYIYNRFNWEIVDGILYLTYPNDPRMNTDIYDYHMTNDRFTGYFDDTYEQFCLYKIRDYYNWTPYVNTYGYGARNNWYDSYRYYAKTRAIAVSDTLTAAPADTTLTCPTQQQEGEIIAIGRRTTAHKADNAQQ